jgi:hypothetical protein
LVLHKSDEGGDDEGEAFEALEGDEQRELGGEMGKKGEKWKKDEREREC